MNVILINGSPKKDGNTAQALGEMARVLESEGIETATAHIGHQAIRGCMACGACAKTGYCIYKDDPVNAVLDQMRAADGIVVGTPTYYAGMSGTLKSFLDRVFYCKSGPFAGKVGATAAIARRAGAVDAVAQISNYFQLAGMVIAPAQYWPVAYGAAPGECAQDGEGLWTLRNQAINMAWLLKSLDYAKPAVPRPEPEPRVRTNFIR